MISRVHWHDFHCDTCPSVERTGGEVESGTFPTGWVRVFGEDLCPACYAIYLAEQARLGIPRWRPAIGPPPGPVDESDGW